MSLVFIRTGRYSVAGNTDEVIRNKNMHKIRRDARLHIYCRGAGFQITTKELEEALKQLHDRKVREA